MQIHKSKFLALYLSCLILIIGLLSIDMYTPSLPKMADYLHTSQASIRSIVIFYLIGMGLSQLLYGPLSDFYGRKPIIIGALLLVSIGNFITIFSASIVQLLLARFITGLGSGGCALIARCIIRDTNKTSSELGLAFTIYAMASQLSPALAPIFGGLIQHLFDWQANFIALTCITLLGLLIVHLFYNETHSGSDTIDLEHIAKHYVHLIKNLNFVIYSGLSALVFSYTIGYYTIAPFILQNTLGVSPLSNGLFFMIYPVGLSSGSYWANKLIKNNFKQEIIINYSIISFLIISIIMYLTYDFISPLEHILIFSFIFSILCGLSAPTLLSLSLSPFKNDIGLASALQGVIKMIGTGITLLLFLKIHVTNSRELSEIFLLISICCYASHLFLFVER